MRLTKDEIEAANRKVSEWQTPTDMLCIAEHYMNALGCKDLFSQAGLNFIFEAWIAAKFGKIRKAQFCKVISEDRPDFELKFDNNEIESYELTEADIPGRRRGKEYKDQASCKDVCHFDLMSCEEERLRYTSDMICNAANKKCEKAKEFKCRNVSYPPNTALLIYFNLGDYGTRQKEIEGLFCRAIPLQTYDLFSSVWILWKECIYRVSIDSLEKIW